MQFDVTFPALPCSILSLDAMDISGEQHLDVVCFSTGIFSFSVQVNGDICTPICVYMHTCIFFIPFKI